MSLGHVANIEIGLFRALGRAQLRVLLVDGGLLALNRGIVTLNEAQQFRRAVGEGRRPQIFWNDIGRHLGAMEQQLQLGLILSHLGTMEGNFTHQFRALKLGVKNTGLATLTDAVA